MKTKFAICAIVAITAIGLVIFAGCSGDPSETSVPTAPVRVVLVDAPANAVEELHLRFDKVELVRASAPVHVVLDRNDLPADVDVIATADTPMTLGTADVPVGTYTWSNLSIDPNSPANRVVTTGGQVHALQYVPLPAPTAHLARRYVLQAGQEVTLLFNFAAAASVSDDSGAWIVRPQVFSRFVEGPLEFGSLSGVVSEVDGDALRSNAGPKLGVFLRDDRRALVDIAEIDRETGEFRMPSLLTGQYQVTVQAASAQWEPAGEPLLEMGGVSVTTDNETVLNLDIDL